MSCLTASATRVGGGLNASVERKGCGCSLSATRVGGRLSASCGLVCTTSLGDEYILWGRDGIIFNVYGDKIYLTRK